MKKVLSGASIIALAVAGMLAVATPASATQTPPPTECVPSDAVPAYTEVVPDIEHPAVGEPTITIDNPDYIPATEGTPAVWANFSPNDEEGTFTGPPTYPTDERGTWHDHGTLPPGQAGPDGVYANGNPDKGGNWFYRQAEVPGTPAEGEPTIVVDNPDYEPAYTEVVPDIEHPGVPAVICEEEPPTFTPSCTTVTGAQTIVGDGVITVPGGWESVSIPVPSGVSTLSDIGTVLDIQATPIQYVGLHIDTPEGTISFEEEPSYGGNLWSQSAWAGVNAGMGYPAFGSISEFIHLNGDVAVTGIRLLYTHPEASSTTVESFTIGCTVYTFEPEVVIPLPEDEVTYGTWTEPVYDCDTPLGTGVPVYQEVTTVTWTRDDQGNPVSSSSTVTEEGVFIVDENAIANLECPVPTEPEPTDPEPKPEPKPEPEPDWGDRRTAEPASLAATGNTVNPLVAGGLGIAVLIAGLGTLAVARRRR